MLNYTRAQLISDINAGLKGKIGMISSVNDYINRVVRETKNRVAIRSGKRKTALTPDLFGGVYQYACPADLQDNRIIDIPAQAKGIDNSFGLVPAQQFLANPRPGEIAIDDHNGQRVLLINSRLTTTSIVLNPTNVAADWTAIGGVENIAADAADYLNGNNSIAFGLSNAVNTIAGIQTNALAAFDITPYLQGNAAVFVWHKINNPANITNYMMRIGSDSSNYYSKTITAKSDGTAFVRGWNLLRFDLSGLTKTGSVDDEAIDYLAFYMTKTTGKVSEAGYKFNYPVLKTGVIHDILYYSKYGWQDEFGVYKQNSTDDGDQLVADDTEYELFVKKGIEIGLPFVNGDMNEITMAKTEFAEAVAMYAPMNPDESQIMVSTYHQQ